MGRFGAMQRSGVNVPFGLYGMLLFALCWLTLPAVFAPIERWLLGTATWLPRVFAAWSGSPVQAAEPAVADRLRQLTGQLALRTQHHDIGIAARYVPAGWQPVHCAVRRATGRGGGGEPEELLLDRSYAELGGCGPFVTKGDVLLGYLARPGEGVAAEDTPDDPARVVLLNHRRARPVHAELTSPAGTVLGLVVGPAAAVDPAQLRADLWSHPYLASQLRHSGQAVHVVPLAEAPNQPPPGLWLGRTRVWGYAGTAGEAPVTIGVYVATPFLPRSLSHVVVWHTGSGPMPSPAAAPLRRLPGVLHELPGASGRRYLLAAAGAVPSGAAVVHAGVCIGVTRGLAFDAGLVAAFSSTEHDWNLILLPSDPAARPRELTGRVVRGEAGAAWLDWRGDMYEADESPLPAGQLFTGSNGVGCPSGLYLGLAAGARPGELLGVQLPVEPAPLAVEVLVVEGDA